MAVVCIKNDNLKIKVPKGTTMRKLALKSGASMEFGCRVGDCGTCVAHVQEGMEYLNQKSEKEILVLSQIGQNFAEIRLMCQVEVICDEGEIVISYGM